jgi:DNA-binding HxlR family transcriptional regulator
MNVSSFERTASRVATRRKSAKFVLGDPLGLRQDPKMRTYGQYCPISRASEILAERWTPLIIRNLLLGCTSFNAVAAGLPGMSRSLLTSRLRQLEDAGVILTRRKEGHRGRVYELTEAGRALWSVIEPMAAWGARWVQLQPEHTDPSFVLWAWVHVHLRRERLPKKRIVVRFTFPDQPTQYRRFWIVFENGDAELCNDPPGFEHDADVVAESEAFTHWHIGRLSWGAALRAGKISATGPSTLVRALPTWNEGAQIA